ncbi:MAG: DUF1824 family protein [Synechococcales cyanobacterium RU_4_20]|nr:DUF1824 family protein [Synechococcales cyanobacterium RU_4_20]NJR67293.1 DUF1824 family protein [Synechococcales cyanobacterium CRU_2_2]
MSFEILPSSTSQAFTPATADAFLQRFVCFEHEPQLDSTQACSVKEALLLLAGLSDFQTLGVCAASMETAVMALNSYLSALGHELQADMEVLPPIDGPVYLKCNTRSLGYYGDRYSGDYRGVLVSCQSDYSDGVVGTYGHFPLDLFVS